MSELPHPRSLIRQAVRECLAQALPALASRIHLHRAVPLTKQRLPALLLYAREERIDDAYAADPGPRRRLMTLAVEIVAAGHEAHERIDALAAVVEAALEADETLGGRVEGSRLVRTEIEQDGDGETPLCACRLSFEIAYWTQWRSGAGETAVRPTLVLYSVSPFIGRAHEDKYQPVAPEFDDV